MKKDKNANHFERGKVVRWLKSNLSKKKEKKKKEMLTCINSIEPNNSIFVTFW